MDNPFRAIDERFSLEPLPGANRPVFLLAAGWRSGSTLLQRLVVSSGDVLVWGEPYGRAGVIPALTRAMSSFRPEWPAPAALAPASPVPGRALADHWIANLYPEPEALRAGLRALTDAWLQAPATARGFARFGLKEVRLSVAEGMLLQWLYPDARFVCLVRNPWDAWSSMKGGVWVLRFPDQVVNRVEAFAQVWSTLWRSLRAWDDEAVLHVRYEDLRDPDVSLDGLAEHVGAAIDPTVRDKNLRGLARPPTPLTDAEIEAIEQSCGSLAHAAGYASPLAAAG